MGGLGNLSLRGDGRTTRYRRSRRGRAYLPIPRASDLLIFDSLRSSTPHISRMYDGCSIRILRECEPNLDYFDVDPAKLFASGFLRNVLGTSIWARNAWESEFAKSNSGFFFRGICRFPAVLAGSKGSAEHARSAQNSLQSAVASPHAAASACFKEPTMYPQTRLRCSIEPDLPAPHTLIRASEPDEPDSAASHLEDSPPMLQHLYLAEEVTGHPRLRKPRVSTPALVHVTDNQRWARTLSRWYRLEALSQWIRQLRFRTSCRWLPGFR